MGVIIKEIEIIGNKGKMKVKALFDSGSSDSLIRRDVAERVATISPWIESVKFVLGDGKTVVKSKYYTALQMNINGNKIPGQHFYVVDEMEDELILGADAFQRWKFKLDFEKEDVIIDKQALRLRIV